MPLRPNPPRRPSNASENRSGSSFPPSIHTAGEYNNDTPDRATSPAPPIASPLTPTPRPAIPVAQRHAPIVPPGPTAALPPTQPSAKIARPDLIDQPPAQPFSGDDATDAIALRAAISSLQFQRKKAEEDIKVLRQIKEDALARSDEFQDHVIATASKQVKQEPMPKFDLTKEESGVDADENPGDGVTAKSPNGSQQPAFPPIPRPQDVVRCPPVNWDKYHIVGEPLDRMHNVQQRGTGHVVAAPFDPATDSLGGARPQRSLPRDSSRDGRKDSGASAETQASDLRSISKISS